MLVLGYIVVLFAVIGINLGDYYSSQFALDHNPNARELNPLARWIGLLPTKLGIIGIQAFAFTYTYWFADAPAETLFVIFILTLAYAALIIHNIRVGEGKA
ncbi:MAG: hypothetical protein KGL39_54890 [Patescibacteria group bacterium]|nr:hypothetical protein [Patescibacteria group bacterium]